MTIDKNAKQIQVGLAKADGEFLLAISKDDVTEAAKISLLLDLNKQHFETNQLLHENLRAACETHQTLHEISGILQQVAMLQKTHFEQVQRERMLKECLFQFEKFVSETEEYDDWFAMAYGIRRFLELLDQDPGFSTADLSELTDKRHFDAMLSKSKAFLAGLQEDQLRQVIDFEMILDLYAQRIAVKFCPHDVLPDIPRENLPVHYLVQTHSPASVVGRLSADRSVIETEIKEVESKYSGPLVMMLLFIFISSFPFGCAYVTVDRTEGQMVRGFQILSGVAALLTGVVSAWTEFSQGRNLKRLKSRLESISAYEKSKRAEAALEWNRKKMRVEAKLREKNKRIDLENKRREGARNQMLNDFDRMTQEIRNMINHRLNQNPLLNKFLQRV